MVFFFPACSQGEVRLVGGQTDKRGRVELCIGGEWGTVANNGWNSRAAQVVCKQIFGDLVTGKILALLCMSIL